MSKQNFTLAELLLVCAVLAILAALLPGLHADDAGRSASCADNMRQIGINALQYASENDDFVPGLYQTPTDTNNARRWLFTMVKFSKDLRLFSCPDSPAFKKHAASIDTCNPEKADLPPDLYKVNAAGSIGVNGAFGAPNSSFAFEVSRKLNGVKNAAKIAYAADTTGTDTAIPEYAKGNSTGLFFCPRLAPAFAGIFLAHGGDKANFLILDGSVQTKSKADLGKMFAELNKRNAESNSFFFVKK